MFHFLKNQARLLIQCILICGLSSFSANADDDRFASDNREKIARSPVLDEPLKYQGTKKINRADLKGLTFHRASEFKQIATLVNRDVLIIGKVESVYIPDSRNKVILNFGADYRNCFKVVIDAPDFEKWGTDDPEKIGSLFEGLELAVDGLISLYRKKPQIVVTLPHQIRTIE